MIKKLFKVEKVIDIVANIINSYINTLNKLITSQKFDKRTNVRQNISYVHNSLIFIGSI